MVAVTDLDQALDLSCGIDLLNFVDLEHASLVFAGAYFDLARTGPG
jgi:hypothetical protein